MKWTPGGESQDIEDRRDEGGGGGFQFGGRHVGIGGALVLLILSFVFRTNLFTLLGGGTGDPGTAVSQPNSNNRNEATGTRLLRRLSKMRHRLIAPSGLAISPFGPGTRGEIHGAICQSPRIQRCCLRVKLE